MSNKKQIVKTALISIISSVVFVLFLGLAFVVYVKVINPRIQIGQYVLREKANPEILISRNNVKTVTEEFNDSNWQVYNKAWGATKTKTSVFASCKSKIDALHLSLEDRHKDYLRSQISNTGTNELKFYEGLYQYTDGVSETLGSIIRTYKLDESTPAFIPEIYVIEDDPEYTKEAATTRLNQILSDFEKIANYAVGFSCIDINDATYANKDKVCGERIELNYSAMEITQPIYREAFEIEEQYKLALKKYQDEKERALYECRK